MRTRLLLAFLCIFGLAGPALAAAPLDDTPRTAVMSAFPAELAALQAATTDQHRYTAGGATFITGTLQGKPVVLFESGMSMVNASMTTQRVIDRFNVTRIVFSGIAGGVDPNLDVGDVVVADQWAQYLESVMAREVAPGKFEPPPLENGMSLAPYGMMYPRGVQLDGEPGKAERRLWFAADPALVALARTIAPDVALKRCVADLCLVKPPKVVVGGNGVSGQSFVDNASLRTYAYQTFGARVLDMETAAVAQVAYVNAVPFIAFRSLSDLAGGDPGANQARVFFQIAADNSAAVVEAFLKAMP
jgi:adenosylhomocysteine nucleosidase